MKHKNIIKIGLFTAILAMHATALAHPGHHDTPIVPREQWGADEELRFIQDESSPIFDIDDGSQYDDVKVIRVDDKDPITGRKYRWPLYFPDKIKKIILHHTGSNKDLDDPLKALKNTYNFHANGRGWGDVGYNYLIDPKGGIYEGRYGGKTVAGGHAKGYNIGSIGIALMGNFNETIPTYESLMSLINFLEELTDENSLEPDTVSLFHDKELLTIAGHREVGNTSCPGHKFFPMLADINFLLAHKDSRGDFEEVLERKALKLNNDINTTTIIQLKNTSNETWTSGARLIAEAHDNNNGTVVFKGDATMKESIVRPGETGTFTVNVATNTDAGFFVFDMRLHTNGKKSEQRLPLPIYVGQPVFDYDVLENPAANVVFVPHQELLTTVRLRNTGTTAWSKNGTNALTFEPDASTKSDFYELGMSAELQNQVVNPGEVAYVKVRIKATDKQHDYRAKIQPVINGSDAFLDPISFAITVGEARPQARISSMIQNATFAPGSTEKLWVELQNTGSGTWNRIGNKKVRMVLHAGPGINVPKVVAPLQADIQPGQIGQFEFYAEMPEKEGEYIVRFFPWLDDYRLIDEPVFVPVTIKKGGAVTAHNIEKKEKNMRIKITAQHDRPEITASTNFSVFDGTAKLIDRFAGETITVERRDNTFFVQAGDTSFIAKKSVKVVPNNNGIVTIKNIERRPAWNPSLNDNAFRGAIDVIYDNEKLTLVNEIDLEAYMKGIGEVPNGEPLEKMKAVLVAARSYAVYYRDLDQKFPEKQYHLDDNPDVSQKYVGYGLEVRSPNIVRAVEETKGEVVTYNDTVVKTPYFSTSDGRTRSAQEVWGWTHTPYLIGVADPLCQGEILRGHGVGLSGCGAKAAAELGKDYKEILSYYYKGVQVKRIE